MYAPKLFQLLFAKVNDNISGAQITLMLEHTNDRFLTCLTEKMTKLTTISIIL